MQRYLETRTFSALLCLVLTTACLPFLVSGCASNGTTDSNVEPKTVTAKIGALLPLGENTGQQARQGIEVAVEALNLDDSQIRFEVKWEDSMGEPSVSSTRMETLSDDASVLGIVGPVKSTPAVAAADVANRNGVVLISPLASTRALAQPNDCFFRTWPSDATEAKHSADFTFSELGARKVVVLNIGAEYGQGLAGAFADYFKAQGGEVLESIEYPADAQKFGAYVERVEGGNPDALYYVGHPPDMAEVLREIRSRELKLTVVSAAIVADPSVAKLAGENAEGLIFPFPVTYDERGDSPQMAEFRRRFEDKFGANPSFISAQAYDAAMLLGKAIRSAQVSQEGLPTRQDVKRAVSARGDCEGATGSFRLDNNGDAVRTFQMFQIKDGQMAPFVHQGQQQARKAA